MWRTCPACGSLVADVEAHVAWHGKDDLPAMQVAFLRFGHPRDWRHHPDAPPLPPAPTEPDEVRPEPPRSVTEIVTGKPDNTPGPPDQPPTP